MKPIIRLILASLLIACLVLVAAPRPASAHPMGNFTINHYSALNVGEDHVDILYVVDMAEIPAFQELGTIRPDHSTDLSNAERDAYTGRKSSELVKNLTLSIDGKPFQLTIDKKSLSFPPGAGGLPTLRLEINLSAALDGASKGTLQYKDDNFAERIGWKEIIARPASGITLVKSSVPQTDLSDRLRSYNPDLLNNPPLVTSASIDFTVGGAAATTAVEKRAQAVQGDILGSLAWVRQQTDAITAVINQKDVPLSGLLLALALAFAVGAAHALSPGHGKTVVAAYLVGSRGTPLHAVILGFTVTASHTIGVFALGLVVLFAADYILPETLYPWLGFASGILIAAMGVTLFLQRRRAWKRTSASAHTHSHNEHTHTHDHDHAHNLAQEHHSEHSHEAGHSHDHDHEHEHAHDHSHEDPTVPHKHGPFGREHAHLPADGQQVTMGSLLALGITGGIIPCPSALVVLLVAVASHRVGLGLVLILAFSFGLAAVLTGIGLLMVYSRSLLDKSKLKFGGGLLGRLPMVSALAVACLGLLIAFGALSQGGVLR